MNTGELNKDAERQEGSDLEKKDLSHWWAFLAGAIVVVVVLALVWAALTFLVYPQTREVAGVAPTVLDPIAARGQFGDMFGAANALFSGLAFTALIISLAMQRKELSLQRLELSMARKEYAKQAGALIDQSKTMERQAHIELLAARIGGVGSVLQLWQATAERSDFQAWLVTKSSNPTNGIRQTVYELEQLLAEAKQLSVPTKTDQ